MKRPAIYIMASQRNGTLYAGVTSNLPQRAFQHREGLTPGLATGYGCKLLAYYEMHEDMSAAIAREKKIKGLSRRRRVRNCATQSDMGGQFGYAGECKLDTIIEQPDEIRGGAKI